MTTNKRFTVLIAFLLFLFPLNNADAYIGPGAGFAFLSSSFIFIVTFFLFFFYLFSLPLRLILRVLIKKKSIAKRKFKRVIIIGFDGMDPRLAEQFMDEGQLPHFKKLSEEGTFSRLATSLPSISPVAWSSFMTGTDPSYHNIFDFLTRDPRTYMPMLSSAEIGRSSKSIKIGKYTIPIGKPVMKLHRKSKPFWTILGEYGVFSSIIRVPITFPPEKFDGVLLSGMCVPDLVGSQGTFSFYTTDANEIRGETGGVCYKVELNGKKISTYLYGPENSLVKGGGRLKTPLIIRLEQEGGTVKIKVCGHELRIKEGSYSPWVKVFFKPGMGVRIHGICRFYLKRKGPNWGLYVSPINIDPEKPALPISYPKIYSVYLSKLIGPYATLGLAEDTWALNDGIIDDRAFLEQAYIFFEEREKMFFKAFEKTLTGLCTCVFDTTDRIQHMFFRYLDETHPANKGRQIGEYKNVIKNLYVRMDTLLGRVLKKIDKQTLLLVISDHGFVPFRRGVNINTWLFQKGYLALKDGKANNGEWLESVDWKRTKAFSIGLTGIYLNRKGRESYGTVEEGEDAKSLKMKLIEELSGLLDVKTGQKAILDVVDTESFFTGPYRFDAPDLLLKYNSGYRSSWDCTLGKVTDSVFEDNVKKWSGDHSVDPKLVPGIFFSNYKMNTLMPDIKDIAPTVLRAFGIEKPPYMKGRSLLKSKY